jgi:hypothetical protein
VRRASPVPEQTRRLVCRRDGASIDIEDHVAWKQTGARARSAFGHVGDRGTPRT